MPDTSHESHASATPAGHVLTPPTTPTYSRTDKTPIDNDFHVLIFKTSASPNWYIQYNDPVEGQKKVSLKVSSKKEAERRAREYAARLRLGQPTTPERKRPTAIAEVAKAYIAWLKTRNRSPKTVLIYERCLAQLAKWGSGAGVTKIEGLTISVLDRYEIALREKGIALPPQPGDRGGRKSVRPNHETTVRFKMKAIRRLIRWSVKHGDVASDPSLHYEVPPAKSATIEVFSPNELALILGDPDPDLRDIWMVYAFTGLRADELCWLTRDDIEKNPWAIRIRAKVCSQSGKRWVPKHGHERLVPVTDPEVIAVLERALAESRGPWLFQAPGTYGSQKGRWRGPRLNDKLKARMDTLGIPHIIPHRTLHTFRHGFASFLANHPGMTLAQVQKVLGHRDVHTTMSYVHVQAADLTRSLGRVNLSEMLRQGLDPITPVR